MEKRDTVKTEDLRSFQISYNRSLTSITCKCCGRHLGLVKGVYSIKCTKCKAITYGDTNKGTQMVSIKE